MITISSSSKTLKTYYVFLLMAVLILFGNTLANDYNLDDNLVTQHHAFTSKGVKGIGKILSNPYYSDQADITFGYRPLVHISFAIEHQLFGESPLVSHLVNLLLFAGSTLLLFRLLLNWFGNAQLQMAFLVAMLFAVHPVHTEVVASIKSRDELLAFVLVMLSGIRLTKNNSNIWLNAGVASLYFALALLAKKGAYPMLFIFILHSGIRQQISFRYLIWLVLLMSVPAALIVSELQWKWFVALTALPLIIPCILYMVNYANRFSALLSLSGRILRSEYVYTILACICMIIGVLKNEYFYVVPAFVFGGIVLAVNERVGIILLALLCGAAGHFFKVPVMERLAVLLSCGYVFYIWNKGSKNAGLFVFGCLVCLTYTVKYFNTGTLLLLVNTCVFFYLVFYRTAWAAVFSLFAIGISIAFFKVNAYMVILSSFAVFVYLGGLKKINLSRLSFAFATGCLLTVLLYSFFTQQRYMSLTNKFRSEKNAVPAGPERVINPAAFKEGRQLHYIENTLVAPHRVNERIATGLITLGHYLRLMIFPNELSFYYGYAITKTVSFSDPLVWMSLVLHVALIVLAVTQVKKRPLLSIGIAWYLACIFLFSNWVQLVAGMVGERLVFTASAGFCLFTGCLIVWLKPQFSLFKPQAAEYAFIAVIVLMSGRTIARNANWKDALTLMQHDIGHLDRSAYAHHALALNLMYVSSGNTSLNSLEAGNMQVQAVEHLKRSIGIYPYFFNAHFDLARVYLGHADYANARFALLNAYRIDSTNLFVLEELAKVSFELKDAQQTEKYANLFLAKEPSNENVHEVLTYIMLTSGYKAKAKQYAERGLRYFPQNKTLQLMLRDSQK